MMNKTEIEQQVTSAFEEYFEAQVTDSDSLRSMVEITIETIIERNEPCSLDHSIKVCLEYITSNDSDPLPIHSRMMIHHPPNEQNDLNDFLSLSVLKFRLTDKSFFRKSNKEQSDHHQTILKFYANRHNDFDVSNKEPTLKSSLVIRNPKLFEALVNEWFPTSNTLLKKALILATAWHYLPKRNIETSEFSNVVIPFIPENFVSSILVFCYLILFGKPENTTKVRTGFKRHFNYSNIFDLLKEEEHIVKIMYIFTDEPPIAFFNKMAEQQYFPNNFIERQLENIGQVKQLQEENRSFRQQVEIEIKSSGEKIKKLEIENKSSGEKIKKLENENKSLGEKIKKFEGVTKNLKVENKSLVEKIKKVEENKNLKVESKSLEKLEGENKLLGEKVEKLEIECNSLVEKVEKLEGENKLLKSLVEKSEEEQKNSDGKITGLEKKIEKLEYDNKLAHEQKIILQHDVSRSRSEIDIFLNYIKRLEFDVGYLKDKNYTLERQQVFLINEIVTLNRLNSEREK